MYLLLLKFAVENFDRKAGKSFLFNSITYPEGNFSGLFLTASLIRFVKYKQ